MGWDPWSTMLGTSEHKVIPRVVIHERFLPEFILLKAAGDTGTLGATVDNVV
jgi:hypothetical protein